MNITGNRNYSRETVGLRQPSTILNQHQRLVFVYPMLFSDKLIQYKETLRDFISLNILKEIFISNSLNLVSLTSQIDPIMSKRDEVNVGQIVGNVSLTLSGANINQVPFQATQDYAQKQELQQKINEKINRITSYLEKDIQLKKLNPKIDFVTLQNMIDVPIIVGTYTQDINTFHLLLILVGSIALSRPLNSMSNVDYIINTLNRIPRERWDVLLYNLDKNQTLRERISDWFGKRSFPFAQSISKRIARQPTSPARRLPGRIIQSQLDRRAPRGQDMFQDTSPFSFTQHESFQILRFNQQNLDQAKVFFKFMLDERAFQSQTGVDPKAGQTKAIVTKIDPNMRQIFSSMHIQFINLIATMGTPILRSISNIIYPVPTPPNFNFLSIKEKVIDTALNNKVSRIIEDYVLENIRNSLSNIDPEQASQEVNIIKNICKNLSQTDNIIEKSFSALLNYKSLDTASYSMSEFTRFISELEKVSGICGSFNKSFQTNFGRIVSNSSDIFRRIESEIYSSLEDFMNEYRNELRPGFVDAVVVNTGSVSTDQIISRFIPQVTEAMFNIFMFFFSYRLQAAMCQLVDFLEVEVEAAAKDVVDFPNYCLVLPVEFMQFLHSVIIAKSWRNLTEKPGLNPNQNPPITESYIKNIVKFVSKRLDIPNLIVIDEAKQDVYYKFMYMSSINKTKLSNIQTFIKQNN